MNTIFTKTKLWLMGFVPACTIALALCFTTVTAQTTYGPFASSAAVDLTPVDNAYNGTLGTMASSTVAVSGVSGTTVVDISVNIGIQHTWIGDLVLMLQNPDGDVLTLMSRAGYAETVPDGTGCCGTGTDWLGEVVTFSDGGAVDAELMVGPVGSSYFPSPGATVNSALSFADFFSGSINGNWTLYVGDAESGDFGTLDSWSISIVTASPSFFTLKFVAEEDGNGDCSDDAFDPNVNVNNITVSSGTDVCYFYFAQNDGDVAFGLHDLDDDVLGPLGAGIPFDLLPGEAVYLYIDPVTITASVTNTATWTAYNAGPVDVVTDFASATVNVSNVPANDLCANAAPIACGQTVAGTTVGSTATGRPNTGVSEGVWYSFTGNGQVVTAATCSSTSGFDSEIVVVSGSCGAFTAVGANDDGCGVYSTVTFTSVLGMNYYIYVADWSGTIGGTNEGAFTLALTCTPAPTVPANDLCANAITMICGQTVSGSTSAATSDASLGTCTTSLTTGPGVWYTYVGTGESVSVTTCNPATNFDTKLGVFSGTCANRVCVGGNDDTTPTGNPACALNGLNRKSTVNFFGVYGTTYYFYVTGFGTASGAFDLSVSCTCTSNAGTITANAASVCMSGGSATVAGTAGGNAVIPTGYQLLYVLANAAGVIQNAGPTASFTVNAAGTYIITTAVYDPLQLNPATLPPGTTLAQVHAMTQAGGGTMCGSINTVGATVVVHPVPTATVSGGGVACDGGSVNVSVVLTGTGPWNVTASDGTSTFPLVASASPTVIPVSAAGTYSVVTVTDANSCVGTSSGSAVVTLGTSPVAAFSSNQVSGTLDVAFTNESTGGETSRTWDFGDGNTSSFASPTHSYGASGTYTVCLISINDCDLDGDTICQSVTVTSPGIPNDLCANAEVISCPTTVIGSTVGSSETGSSDCAAGSLGVWYTFTGDGNAVTISTANAGTDYDTFLALYESCGGLCVAADDDNGGNLTSIIDGFPTVNGQEYYIYMTGFGPSVGAFELTLECVLPPVNDNVCDAIALSIGANGPFSTVAASIESGEPVPPATGCELNDGWCDFESEPRLNASTWYTFVAPASGAININTDNSYDTQIAVYDAASCQDILTGAAVLLGANDDNPNSPIVMFSSALDLCGLTPGATYYLQVDGYAGTTGNLNVLLTELPAPVTASFSNSAAGLVVDFTDASTAVGSIVDWAWDFGDGNTSSDQSPSNTYGADGSYTVCLTVTDADGCTSTSCVVIQVADIPTTIAEAVNGGMEVYPNPSNGQFVVTILGVEADVQVIVMDVAGRQVYSEGVVLNGDFRKELNLNVARGSYVLQIATMEGMVNRMIQVH